MKISLGAKTIAFPTPAWVIGTYDRQGRPNVMTAAWAGVCCSKPPCITVSLRKATYTYGSILAKAAYTVNVFSRTRVAEVDYFGIASGRDRDKFADTGLTPVRSELVDAPYVSEASLVIECRLIQTLEIGYHTQFIGEIVDVKADKAVLDQDGLPDIESIKPIIYAPTLRSYYAIGEHLGKAYFTGKKLER